MKQNTLPCAVFAYVHHNRRTAALVTLRCKTDFALRTDVLQNFGQQLAMHVTALGGFQPTDAWVRDPARTVQSVIEDTARQLGEPVTVFEVHVQS